LAARLVVARGQDDVGVVGTADHAVIVGPLLPAQENQVRVRSGSIQVQGQNEQNINLWLNELRSPLVPPSDQSNGNLVKKT
jgi:hypothetical protein